MTASGEENGTVNIRVVSVTNATDMMVSASTNGTVHRSRRGNMEHANWSVG